ncbi:MAG: PilN domain-containing protein [Deltaproteobacteria bacterium]|nr:PilN domain-containing protein [Deltaproteobacteria bacterium]
MIRINLLPFRAARKKENIRREVSIYFLALIFLFMLMPYTYISLNSTLAEVTSEEKQLREKMKPYRKLSRIIAQMNKWKKETTDRLKVIETLEKMRTGPVRLLVDVATCVPPHKLWLTSLEENGGVLTLSGNAMDNDTVALFMTNLASMKEINTVDLKETRLSQIVSYVNVPKKSASKKTKQEEAEEKRQQEKEEAKAAEVERRSVAYKITKFTLTCNIGYHLAQPQPASKKPGSKKKPSKARR